MKIALIVFILLSIGCRSSSKVGEAAQNAESLACPSELDANQGCPASMATIPLNEQRAPSPSVGALQEPLKSITGRCEMTLAGRKGVKTCSKIKLTAKSVFGDEEKTATIDGFNFVFSNLKKTDFKISASSDRYEVVLDSEGKTVSAGTSIKLRVRAKPKRD